MKKNLLVMLAFMALGLAASAQTEKGNFLVGGSLEVNTAKNSTPTVAFTPAVGYFFLNNLAAGLNFNLDYSKVGENKTTVIGVGPFARYYVGTLNIRPFAQANLGFNSYRSKNTTGSDTYNGTNYFLGGGLSAFINRNVAVEGLIGYAHSAYAHTSGSGGLNLKIGFQVYLSHAQVTSVKNNL